MSGSVSDSVSGSGSVSVSDSVSSVSVSSISDSVPSSSLYHYLLEIKKQMDELQVEWDNYKKYTNPYEFIHTHISNSRKCISKMRPISRSYYKMIEILATFRFTFKTDNITTFHLAEGPGGFIEALVQSRSNSRDVYYGMTLQDTANDNVPGWKKSNYFLATHPNVKIENGADKTGNILSLENFKYCHDKYHGTMDFITADGGFDFTENFNDQEVNMLKLLFAQISFALSMQAPGGHFVLKIFDFYLPATLDLIYLLSSFYERVYIVKPDTSRYANSEKYLVCIHYNSPSFEHYFSTFYSVFQEMLEMNTVSRFLQNPLSYYFTNKLEEYNCCFGQQQIENIHNTLQLIKLPTVERNSRIQELLKNNIAKCQQWCFKFNI